MRKIKVVFYMKSGNTITAKFKEFEVSRLSASKGERTMTWSGCSLDGFTIDIDQIECVTFKKTIW